MLKLICIRGVIGDWVFYSTTMTAIQINEWVKSYKEIRESKSLDEVLQRTLKERKYEIAKYLMKEKSRFFNSLIIGCFGGLPDWLEFEIKNDKSIIESEQSVGILRFNGNEQMFAIDGQHRVAGIDIAISENKYKKNESFYLDQFPIILIAHIDDEKGNKRTRKLFSDINKKAKPVSYGDNIIIDEEDVAAIVTRKIYSENKYFKKGSLISLTENARLNYNDISHFTNLIGLYKLIKKLSKLIKTNKNISQESDNNVLELTEITNDFLDFIFTNITDYKNYFILNSIELKDTRINNSFLLFRPVGLNLIGRLYVYFYHNLEYFKIKINLISFIFPHCPLNKVIWNEGKMDIKKENISFQILLYILNQLNEVEESNLLSEYKIIMKNPYVLLPAKV